MKELIIAAVLILGLILQGTLFPFLEIRGVKPDLVMLLLIGMGYCGGNPVGLLAGLFIGTLADVIHGQAIGLHGLQYMLIGFGAGVFYKKVRFARYLIPLILTAGACLTKYIVLYIYLFFRQVEMDGGAFWSRVALPEMGYSLLLAYPVYFLMQWLFGKKVMDRRIRGHWFDF